MLRVTQATTIPKHTRRTMLKIRDRYVPDHVHVDAVEPMVGNVYHITRTSKHTAEFIAGYISACMVQLGAREFKTLKEVNDYEEE